MELEERKYSVLIVCAGEILHATLSSLMPESRYYPIRFVSSVSAARREWNAMSYDFVIINSPCRDDNGVEFSIDVLSSKSAVALLLLPPDLQDTISENVLMHGVYTLSKPLSRNSLSNALEWMTATRERLRNLEKKTLSLEEKMKEIRMVNRAKWLLISALGMDESQAHRYIEKKAMDSSVSKKEVADLIIKTYS